VFWCPGDQRELAIAFQRALPAPCEMVERLLATDERCECARSAAPPSACAHDAVERHRRRCALERMRAPFLGDEQARDLMVDIRRHDDRAGLRERLNPCGVVWRLAKDFARCVDDQGPRVDADARGKLGRAPACVAGVEFGERWMASAARTARSASFSCAFG
jgi:hypothetical protein